MPEVRVKIPVVGATVEGTVQLDDDSALFRAWEALQNNAYPIITAVVVISIIALFALAMRSCIGFTQRYIQRRKAIQNIRYRKTPSFREIPRKKDASAYPPGMRVDQVNFGKPKPTTTFQYEGVSYRGSSVRSFTQTRTQFRQPDDFYDPDGDVEMSDVS